MATSNHFIFISIPQSIHFIFRFSESLEDLTVKQLKEILMLNRIDFKGCCEKGELLERVQRLWQDMHSCPGKSHAIHMTFLPSQSKLFPYSLPLQLLKNCQPMIYVKFVWTRQLNVYYLNAAIWPHAPVVVKCSVNVQYVDSIL